MSAAERFWAKVDRSAGPDGCWPWTGYRNEQGYGSFALEPSGQRGRHAPMGAHRVAMLLTVGPPPRADRRVVVRHRCDNPPCVNPAHLEYGTYADNMRDMVERGRAATYPKVPTKLTADDVRAIRADRSRPPGHVAADYGVSRALIRQIRDGTRWKQVA